MSQPLPPVRVLTLFVAGASPLSMQAIAQVRAHCETYIADAFTLDVVDVHRDADRLAGSGIIAAPTLVRETPLPRVSIVGDMSDSARLRRVLGVDDDGRLR